MLVFTLNSPVILASPLTTRKACGDVTPIPTLPPGSIVSRVAAGSKWPKTTEGKKKTSEGKKTKTCSLDEAKVKSCESQKDKKRADYISAMIGVIIFPLTFYPIYLGLRRLFIWVREGFKK